ncbi:MAG TPA: YHS domain-containing protein, partial [Candidatus Omnitrophota bacterium]|nr:YHS domain-containing protein [Candidatus Omnitrophota bacterium]
PPAASESTTLIPQSACNKRCPITGGEVEQGKYTVEYEGVTYNVCSEECKREFERNPKKYIREIERQNRMEMQQRERTET